MPVSPIVLLDAVSQVGFGPIINMGDAPIRPILWRVEPSPDAQINNDGGITNGILIQYSTDASFPQPPEGHFANQVTRRLCMLPVDVNNPEGNPAPQGLIGYFQYEVENIPMGQTIVLPYLRAKLLYPLSQGTITVKFFFADV